MTANAVLDLMANQFLLPGCLVAVFLIWKWAYHRLHGQDDTEQQVVRQLALYRPPSRSPRHLALVRRPFKD